MRIGIDCRLAGHRHAGIGRYIENLILRLPSVSSETLVLFFHDKAQLQVIFGDTIPKNVEVHFAPYRHYSLAEQFLWPLLLWRSKLDILHVPHFNIPLLYFGKLIVTIHDLLWHEYKGTQVTTLSPWVYWIKYLMYRFVTTQAIQRAKVVFVPAETVKSTLTKYYPLHKSKIIVTKEGVSQAFQSHQQVRKQNSHQLLYVGSLYPHKNVTVVLKTLQLLPSLELRIVGSRSIFQEQTRSLVHQLGLDKRVHFLGYLSDAELAKEYAAALALVQPSLSEGFGLTGIEAMAQEVAVLASDIPIFHEIYQNAAIYFNPHQPSDLKNAIEKLQTQPIKPEVMRQVIATYNWEKMTQQTYEAYRLVALS